MFGNSAKSLEWTGEEILSLYKKLVDNIFFSVILQIGINPIKE